MATRTDVVGQILMIQETNYYSKKIETNSKLKHNVYITKKYILTHKIYYSLTMMKLTI